MTPRRADPMVVLRARAQTRGYLYRSWEIPNVEAAVQPLIDYAEKVGLIERYGAKVIAEIIREAFGGPDDGITRDDWDRMWSNHPDAPEPR